MGNEPSHLVVHARSSSFPRQLPRLYIGNSYKHTSNMQVLVRLTLQSSIVEDEPHVVPIIHWGRLVSSSLIWLVVSTPPKNMSS